MFVIAVLLFYHQLPFVSSLPHYRLCFVNFPYMLMTLKQIYTCGKKTTFVLFIPYVKGWWYEGQSFVSILCITLSLKENKCLLWLEWVYDSWSLQTEITDKYHSRTDSVAYFCLMLCSLYFTFSCICVTISAFTAGALWEFLHDGTKQTSSNSATLVVNTVSTRLHASSQHFSIP